MDRDTELKLAKDRARNIRKETEVNSITDLGFENELEFVMYHWDKLSEEDKAELRKVGVDKTCSKHHQ